MGIPKFFRYISERWPLTSQEIDAPQMIEFDNLYLDMNSILHNCTHSNDGRIQHLSDEQMFGAIFAYIDHLFNTIKPQKVFYMAIDGVAPRAKMNQQRARRFRSAKEAEQNMAKAIERGDPIPKEAPFDTNAITPGTVFMAKVTQHLQYYINQKVSTDTNWQNIQVILSGHEVPGEGEHKIMEYIRTQRAQPGYDVNTRHCVYGLDADLIMLGLVSHEPHFAILREEVTFGRNKTTSEDLTKQKFFLLHISLVREYLEIEFADLKDTITFEYDFERVLDDWILIMYVIGNDFLPNLPDLHLNKGAFPLLLETFKEAMRRTDGYLNDNGKINMERFSVWLDILSIFELENFERGSVDVEWFNEQLDNISQRGAKKRAREGKELILKQQKKLVGALKAWILKVYREPFDVQSMLDDESKIPSMELPPEFFESDINLKFVKQFAFDTGLVIIHSKSKNTYTARIDVDGIDPAETPEEFENRVTDIGKQIKKYQSGVIVEDENVLNDEKDLYSKKFIDWKNQYYKAKMNFTLDDTDKITELTENYVEGLQWVLYYYYRGVASWPWYFRHHYAPRISDVARGLKVAINFQKGQPFKPFQQLMGVLPERSKELIPACYRPLMTDPKSPIIDFYPDDCAIDMNGKKQTWEAVVLLSFIDEKRLIEAMAPYDSKLTPEEVKRNTFGKDIVYNFNPQVKHAIKSTIPEWLPDIESHCIESEYKLPSMDGLDYVSGLCKGALLGTHALAGFPTMKSIPFTPKLEYAQLVVFQQPSRSVSVILTLQNVFAGLSVEQFAKKFLGKIVYTNYPYLRESRVAYVTDSENKYELIKKGKDFKLVVSPLENFEKTDYEKDRREIMYQMRVKKGLHFARGSEQILPVETDGDIIVEDDDEGNHHNKKNHKKGGPPIEGLVYVRQVVGLAPTKDGANVKVLSKDLTCYPLQLIVENVLHHDDRYKETPAVPLEEAFPVGMDLVFLGSFAYGAPAKVVGYDDGKLVLTVVRVGKGKEPTFGSERARYEKHALRFHPSYQAAKTLRINPLFLSRITSMYMIYGPDGRKYDVGLGLKFEGRQQKVLGYTRKRERWEYSDLAIATINEYQHKFPEVFSALKNLKGHAVPEATDLFRGVPEDILKKKLQELNTYLKGKRQEFVRVSLDSDSLTKFGIGSIEKHAIDYSISNQSVEKKGIKGIPRTAVFDPTKEFMLLQKQFFELGDRVIYAMDSGKVPLYSKGTVVGVRSYESKILLQVVFDQPVLTGNTFDGRLETQRGLTVDSSALVNLTNRQFVYYSEKQRAAAKKPANARASDRAKRAAGKAIEQQKATAKAAAEQQAKKSKSKKALLSVINKKDESEEKSEEKDAAAPAAAAPAATPSIPIPAGHSNVQNIYNSVLGNVLSAGQPAPPPMPMPMGMPLPPQGMVYPPPNGMPPPGAFQYTQPTQAPASGEMPTGPRNGGHGGRGRGGRRGDRGGRGRGGRGSGRGRGN